jgi:hypothetical protein
VAPLLEPASFEQLQAGPSPPTPAAGTAPGTGAP